MKGGVTKKLENTVDALEKGQIKKALYLTNREGMEKHHQWVREAAQACVADKEKCKQAMGNAKDKIQETITPPLEDTSLVGLEEYIKEEGEVEVPLAEDVKEETEKSVAEKTDEELYEECEECHVANAVTQFDEIHREHPSKLSQKLIDDNIGENVEPVDWIKNMITVAEKSGGEAKEKYGASLDELASYLDRRKSPFLRQLDEGNNKLDSQE